MKADGAPDRIERVFRVIALFLFPLACFYLFVFPALVATYVFPPTIGTVLFGAFLYVQLWMLIATTVYESASDLYGFTPRKLFQFPARLARDTKRRPRSRSQTILAIGLSFGFSVYGFAVLYAFIASSDPKAFSVERLDLFSATYFSLVTIATVGYGDILPVSVVARLAAMAEILVGMAYAVFLFSIIAAFIREPAQEDGESGAEPAHAREAAAASGMKSESHAPPA